MIRLAAAVALAVVLACSSSDSGPGIGGGPGGGAQCQLPDASLCAPACAAGEFCGSDGTCHRTACASDADCAGRGACDASTGACRCAPGSHLCGDACLCDDSVDSCGARCDACPSAARAPWMATTCEPVVGCSYACPAGQIHCDGGCCTVASATVGDGHVCAVTNEGGAVCWGSNQSGELGDGSLVDRLRPTDVTGLAQGVLQLAAGTDHTCARASAGVLCWGSNAMGELGVGAADFVPHLAPEAVSGIGAATDLAAAAGLPAEYTCAIAGGNLSCWGAYLGFSGPSPASPAQLSLATQGRGSSSRVAVRVAAGDGLAAVLRDDGTVAYWSYDAATTAYVLYDVLAPGGAILTGVMEVAAGTGAACALTGAGEVYCFTPAAGNATSARVAGLSGVSSIAAGVEHFCAVAGGAARCWGGNVAGQLGNGTYDPSATPVAVTGLESGVASVAAGGYQSCAVTTAGAMKCWGDNPSGVLGVPWSALPSSPTPVDVSSR